jgi:hypothetical protein
MNIFKYPKQIILSNALSKCMSTHKILTLRTVVLTKLHDNHTTDTVFAVKYLYIVFCSWSTCHNCWNSSCALNRPGHRLCDAQLYCPVCIVKKMQLVTSCVLLSAQPLSFLHSVWKFLVECFRN